MNQKSIKSNLIYNIFYQILILIVPLITTPYVSRVLNPSGLGSYSVTTAITKYFVLFALLGMNNYGNRMIAKSRKNKLSDTFWSLWYFQLLFSLITIFLYFIYIFIFGYKKYHFLILCQIPYILSSIFEVSWFFYGMEEFKLMVKRNIFIKIFTMILIFYFVKNQNDVWIYILINSLSLLFGQLILWPKIIKNVEFRKFDFSKVKKHFKPNLVLFVSVLAVSIYTLMDKIMIEQFSSIDEVGYYENAEKIFNIAINIVGAIGAVMLPRISNLEEEKNNKKINEYIKKSLKYIMIFAIAITCGIFSVAKPFSLIFFGEKFEKCGLLLMVLSPAIVFYSWSNILRTQYLLPKEKDKIFVKGTIYAAIVNFAINLLLIPKYGSLGAVIGTVGAQLTESLFQTIKIEKELTLKKDIIMQFPYIVFGIIMYFVCLFISKTIDKQVLSLIMQILFGGLIYILLTGIYLYIIEDELIFSLFMKRKKGAKNEQISK